jgi:hypothetical protein
MRATGATLIVASDGRALAWVARKEHSVLTFLREAEAERDSDAELVAQALSRPLLRGERRALLISQIDGQDARDTPLAQALLRSGFQPSARGLLKRGVRPNDEAPSLERRALAMGLRSPNPAEPEDDSEEPSDDEDS